MLGICSRHLIILQLAVFLVCINSLVIPNIHKRQTLDVDPAAFNVDSSLIPGFENSWNEFLTMKAGHIPVTDDLSTLYFWSFHSINSTLEQNDETKRTILNKERRPLVIWLNGGPGCSSMDGALMEVGPLRVDEASESIRWNDGWFKKVDLVFIDQPLGTGFSNKLAADNYDSNLVESSNHLFRFIETYFTLFPDQYNNYDEIFIAGESYAGQYIPHLARLLKDSPKFSDKLKAILLGNAWLEPNLQSLSYIPFAIENKLVDPSSQSEARKFSNLLQHQDQCQNARNSRNSDGDDSAFEDQNCEQILTTFLSAYKTKDKKCVNVYDIEKTDSYPSCGNNWPEILPEATSFLNNANVQKALNVFNNLTSDSNIWRECNNNVHYNFKPKTEETAAQLLNDLLLDGVKVNLFSGTNDLICNYLGTEMVIKEYAVNYLEKFNFKILMNSLSDSPYELTKRDIEKFKMDFIWLHDDEVVGSFWQRGNLTYTKIDKASHMVAYDVSLASIGLLDLALRDDADNTNENESQNSKIRTFTDDHNDHAGLSDGESNDSTNIPEPPKPTTSKTQSIIGWLTSRRVLAFILLFILLTILSVYLYRFSTQKPSRYSALAGGHSRQSTYTRYAYEWVSGASRNKSNKKKRVHWIDDDPMDVEQNVEEQDLQNTQIKSYELEDLQIDLNKDYNIERGDKPALVEGSLENANHT